MSNFLFLRKSVLQNDKRLSERMSRGYLVFFKLAGESSEKVYAVGI